MKTNKEEDCAKIVGTRHFSKKRGRGEGEIELILQKRAKCSFPKRKGTKKVRS